MKLPFLLWKLTPPIVFRVAPSLNYEYKSAEGVCRQCGKWPVIQVGGTDCRWCDEKNYWRARMLTGNGKMLQVKEITDLGDNDYEMQVEWIPPWFLRVIGFRPKAIIYFGNCTAWHREDGKRTGTWMEGWLAEKWTLYRREKGEQKNAKTPSP